MKDKKLSPLKEALKRFYAQHQKGEVLRTTIDSLSGMSRAEIRKQHRKLINK